jgi:hypothetical protein
MQGVITPQALTKETEAELSDSEVLTLPGGFKHANSKSLASPQTTRLSEQLPKDIQIYGYTCNEHSSLEPHLNAHVCTCNEHSIWRISPP